MVKAMEDEKARLRNYGVQYNLDVAEHKRMLYKKFGNKRSKISLILEEGEFPVQVNKIHRLQRV
jgi:hypothetical protein